MWHEEWVRMFSEEIICDQMAEAIMWNDMEIPEWVRILCAHKGINLLEIYEQVEGRYW